MSDGEDWLQDPLIEIGKGIYQFHEAKSLGEKQYSLWRSFHFATRLKLDAADYFCRQVLGAASMPDNLGLPLLAHRHLKWHLDAFFFELMSAYDTLLQELNILYAHDLGLKSDAVRWNKIKSQLPDGLRKYMDEEKRKEWFKKVRSYRITATHHYLVPTGHYTVGYGDKPWDYAEHEVSIYYLDNTGEARGEKISVCPTYLKKMVEHIHQVWKEI